MGNQIWGSTLLADEMSLDSVNKAILDLLKKLNSIANIYLSLNDVQRTGLDAGDIGLVASGSEVIKLINKTGGSSTKGTVVSIDGPGSVKKCVAGQDGAIGIIVDSGIPQGEYVKIAISGIAEVLFLNAPTAGQMARTFLTTDTPKEDGKAVAEDYSPSITGEKQFCKLGFCLETKNAPGLAHVVLKL